MTRKERKYSLGIDLGGTKIAVGLCHRGKIHKKVVRPTNAKKSSSLVIAEMVDAAKEAMADIRPSEVAGIGIGAAGQIESNEGTVIYGPNLRWENVPLGKEVSRKMSLPVKVVNDVRAATLAELKYGSGKGHKNFVNVFIGTGIGSGFVIHGKLLNGITNSAGEIGHICLDPEGPLCGCGKKGCFEAFSSGKGLENYVKEMISRGTKSQIIDLISGDAEKVTGHIIGQAARKGDALALDALRRVGKYLGLAFANVHTMLNPEIILMGGGMMALKEFFLPEMESTLKRHILPVAMREKLFGEAKFENDACMIGSSALFS